MISYEEYYPYGRSAYRAAASGVDLSLKRYRFTGKERDEETGLDYFGVRYYASWLGRWTSGDPGGFVDGLNLYRYVRNNPVNGIDREGYSTENVEKPLPEKPKKGKPILDEKGEPIIVNGEPLMNNTGISVTVADERPKTFNFANPWGISDTNVTPNSQKTQISNAGIGSIGGLNTTWSMPPGTISSNSGGIGSLPDIGGGMSDNISIPLNGAELEGGISFNDNTGADPRARANVGGRGFGNGMSGRIARRVVAVSPYGRAFLIGYNGARAVNAIVEETGDYLERKADEKFSNDVIREIERKIEERENPDNYISIWKAPAPGKYLELMKPNAFNEKNFPRDENNLNYKNGKAYFAEERILAEEYARNYGDGIIEIRIRREEYENLLQYRKLYQGGPQWELAIPKEGWGILNSSEKIHHKGDYFNYMIKR